LKDGAKVRVGANASGGATSASPAAGSATPAAEAR
jgi:hypothetical protein